ncbi:MAG: branched-chain amino acid aminotransferase [Planctomycetaceae bacterium]
MKSALKKFLAALWNDERGFVVSSELVLVGTIAVLSMVVGLHAVSRSITHELFDVARSFRSVNQPYDDNRYGDNGNSDEVDADFSWSGRGGDGADIVAQ